MSDCPACGRRLPHPTPPQTRKCWCCGAEFQQLAGRPRLTCRNPKCLAARRRYRKQGLAALDRMAP